MDGLFIIVKYGVVQRCVAGCLSRRSVPEIEDPCVLVGSWMITRVPRNPHTQERVQA